MRISSDLEDKLKVLVDDNKDNFLGFQYFMAIRTLFEDLTPRNAMAVIAMLADEMASKEGVSVIDYLEEIIRVASEVRELWEELYDSGAGETD